MTTTDDEIAVRALLEGFNATFTAALLRCISASRNGKAAVDLTSWRHPAPPACRGGFRRRSAGVHGGCQPTIVPAAIIAQSKQATFPADAICAAWLDPRRPKLYPVARGSRETIIIRSLMFVMAIAAGVAAASIYINQPLLGLLELAFSGHQALVRMISTVTQMGYAVGLILLVPLGDIIERRQLILVQLVVLAIALGVAAAAPGAATLLAASLLIGVSASLAQQIVPFAAELSHPDRRGKTVGTVMSGLLAGILLGRVVAGIVGHHAGWRAVFVLQLGLVVVTFILLAISLPRRPPSLDVTYRALLASLADLWRREPALRAATITQAALFASFIAFWTVLTLELDRAYGLGPQSAGLFGLVGAAGVLFAPAAGHSADRRGPRIVIRASTIMMLLAWLVFGCLHGIVPLVLGVVLLDLGEQGALISHQQIIYALHPEARGRLNTIFMGGMFIGSTLGSAVAVLIWDHGGWRAVCAFGAGLCLVAAFGHRAASRVAPTASQR